MVKGDHRRRGTLFPYLLEASENTIVRAFPLLESQAQLFSTLSRKDDMIHQERCLLHSLSVLGTEERIVEA
jgi:hypothetical protein